MTLLHLFGIPEAYLWLPAGTQGWKVKPFFYIKPGQKGDENPDETTVLSLVSRF